jgi:hypothetical protein
MRPEPGERPAKWGIPPRFCSKHHANLASRFRRKAATTASDQGLRVSRMIPGAVDGRASGHRPRADRRRSISSSNVSRTSSRAGSVRG